MAEQPTPAPELVRAQLTPVKGSPDVGALTFDQPLPPPVGTVYCDAASVRSRNGVLSIYFGQVGPNSSRPSLTIGADIPHGVVPTIAGTFNASFIQVLQASAGEVDPAPEAALLLGETHRLFLFPCHYLLVRVHPLSAQFDFYELTPGASESEFLVQPHFRVTCLPHVAAYVVAEIQKCAATLEATPRPKTVTKGKGRRNK